MLRQWILTLVAVISLTGAALADDGPATISDSHLAAARDVLDAQHARETSKAFVEAMFNAVINQVRREHPDVKDATLKIFADAVRDEFDNSLDDLLTMQAKVYAEHFSEDELHQLAAFYRSDIGRKYISELPAILKEISPISVAWGHSIAQKAIAKALEKLHKEGVSL